MFSLTVTNLLYIPQRLNPTTVISIWLTVSELVLIRCIQAIHSPMGTTHHLTVVLFSYILSYFLWVFFVSKSSLCSLL